MNKKAQGLSLNTIIIAIIVLIVLVVLIMVFTGYFGAKFTPGVTSCANSGGACRFESVDDKGCGFDAYGSRLEALSGNCPGEQICCPKGLGSGKASDSSKSVPCKASDWTCTVWSECFYDASTFEGFKVRTCSLKNTGCTSPDAVKPEEYSSC